MGENQSVVHQKGYYAVHTPASKESLTMVQHGLQVARAPVHAFVWVTMQFYLSIVPFVSHSDQGGTATVLGACKIPVLATGLQLASGRRPFGSCIGYL